MNKQITVTNIHKSFGEDDNLVVALDNISFSAKLEKITCLMGSSGSGKSTMLRIMAGLINPSSGKIYAMPKRVGFVFQNFGLFPWLTVEQNIGFGLKMADLPKNEIQRKVTEQIEKLNLVGFEKTLPKDLSGGMRQRVGLGRALAVQPEILLLDEPFSALDEVTAKDLRQDLLKIYAQEKTTIIMVTHLAEEAVFLADDIVVFSKRPAKVVKVLKNNLKRPRDTRSHDFFNLVDDITSSLSA